MAKKKTAVSEAFENVVSTNYYGLEYVTVTYLNCRVDPNFGALIPARAMQEAEIKVTGGIIERGFPIRGKELKFMRKTLGITSRELAEFFLVSHPTILAWEKDSETKLSQANEVALRVYFAHRLGASISKHPKNLLEDSEPTHFEVTAA